MCPFQAVEGSESPSIVVMVLNSDNEALLMRPTGKDGSVALKALISSSAFLEVSCQQTYPSQCVHLAAQQLSLQHAGITLGL